MKFQVGDLVRLATILPPNDQYLVELSKIAAENHGVSFDAIQLVTGSTDRGFVTTDLMGGPWQEERFELVEETRVPTTNPFSWSGAATLEPAPLMRGVVFSDQFDVLKKWRGEFIASTPFSEMSIGDNTQSPYTSDEARAANTKVDQDLQRPDYHEECSEYRACQNENGDWVIEATRRKIIAQASDEAEAQRIAYALNSTTN